MIEFDLPFIYNEVKDGIIVNRLVGTSAYKHEEWIKEEYPTAIGWKQIEENLFVPPHMSKEQFDALYSSNLAELEEKQTYYNKLINSTHYKEKLTEDIRKQVMEFYNLLETITQKVKENKGWVISYEEEKGRSLAEPFRLRPNLENEV